MRQKYYTMMRRMAKITNVVDVDDGISTGMLFMLQCVAVRVPRHVSMVVCCSVCCSVLQCVAVSSRVLMMASPRRYYSCWIHLRVWHDPFVHVTWLMHTCMGWLRSVGSIKLHISFAEYCLFYGALLQKRPIILSILRTKATPYHVSPLMRHFLWTSALHDSFMRVV